MYKTITVEQNKRGVATLSLNRPEVHNAFDEVMIAELHQSLKRIDQDDDVRVLLIRAVGKSFSAGADLKWMQRAAGFSKQENLDDAVVLADLLRRLDTLSKPTVAFVHGATFGGGVGLISCCDIVTALERAVFSLSEAKLGLVPAVISPYVVRAMGARAARRYFQSAERFNCTEALRIGLVHQIVDSDDALEPVVEALLQAGPQAQQVSKQLIARVAGTPIDDELIQYTADTIARVRASAEGREGVNAFLERRAAAWVQDDDE